MCFDPNKYIEVPWDEKGSDGSFSGSNCYGLVRLIYQEEFGISLPKYEGVGYTKGIDKQELGCLYVREKSRWWEDIECPSCGDVVWLRVAGNPYHVGVMLSSDTFIHIEEGCGPVIEAINTPRWARRVNGYVRWKK